MLNAQPMGFYSPATLVEDGKHHGVVVLPVEIQSSEWDCTLVKAGEGHGVRMGLRYVKGLKGDEGARIVWVREAGVFLSIDDLAQRASLNRGTLGRLAESGALEGFGKRRDALWDTLGVDTGIAREFVVRETESGFEALSSFDEIKWDYAYTSHSTRGHPLAPLREELTRQKLPNAATIRGWPNGKRLRYAGMVICRQRPGTARGVVFMTLEDETGFVNLVIWEKVFKEYEIIAKTQSFLGVSGKLQTQSGVTHLVVEALWVPEFNTQPGNLRSRDFH
jgi:error-prone DNA polymerase